MKARHESHHRASTFAASLDLALIDKKIELDGVRITYYYDADVILPMVMGFAFDHPRRDHPSDEARLVRALLSCGFFGTASMLRPHALEFYYYIQRQSSGAKVDRGDFSRRARQYLKDKGIESLAQSFRNVLAETSGSQALDRLLEILRGCAGPAFVALESINGSWTQRLRRYRSSNILSFDNLGPEMEHLLPARTLQFEQVVEAIRANHVPRTDVSDAHDSAALIMLGEMIEARPSDYSKGLVRFYTETPTLHQSWARSTFLKTLLSYENSDYMPTEESRFIVRDSLYFLIRAMFPELAPNSQPASLERMETLLALLREATSRGEREFEETLRRVEWEGRAIGEIIRDFGDYSLLKSIWIDSYPLPRQILEELPGWGDVVAFIHGAEAGGRIFTEIEDIRLELEEHLIKIKNWNNDFELFMVAGKAARKKIAAPIENPMRDLGLVRWGYNLPEYEKDELVQTVGNVLSNSEEDLLITSAELATRMSAARRDVRACLFMCAVLWALGRFLEIVQLVEACSLEMQGHLPGTLSVIRAASELKCRIADKSERARIVNSIWQLKVSLPQEESAGILLGVSYVLYHAWKQETIGRHISQKPLSPETREWAKMSISAAQEACEILPHSELAWAFSVNHCAYVGIVTGENECTEKYFLELLRLQGFPLWNSRFDDTIGVYYLKRAEDGLDAGITKQEIFEDLARAQEYFSRAKASDFGDIDLDEHIARLDWVRVSVARRSD